MGDKEKQLLLDVLGLLYRKGLNSPQESMLALAFGQLVEQLLKPKEAPDAPK